MDQAMMESVMAFPAETDGRRQPAAASRRCCRRHQALRADRVDRRLGGQPGQDRPGLGLQRAWSPARASTSRSATRSRCRSPTTCRSAPTSTGTASTSPTTRTAWPRSPRSSSAAARRYTYRFTATEAGDRHVPRPRPRRHEPSPTGCSARCTSATSPAPAGRTVSGIEIPADLTVAQDIPMVAQRRRRHRPHPQRQELPGHRRRSSSTRATGSRSPTSTRACRSTRCTCTASSRSSTPRTASRSTSPTPPTPSSSAPVSATRVLFHADQVGTWVWHCHILNHVESRRRHVRHGHRRRRAALRSAAAAPPASIVGRDGCQDAAMSAPHVVR